MKKSFLWIVVAFTLLLTSCGTLFEAGNSNYKFGLSSYQSKNYLTAINELNKALEVNPEFEEVISLYPIVFIEGVDHYSSIIASAGDIETPKKADKIYEAYSNLDYLYEKAAVNANRFNLDIKDVSQEAADAKTLAGELWYYEGVDLIKAGSRESMIEAISALEKAKRLECSMADLDERLEYAIQESIITIMVVGHSKIDSFHNRTVEKFQEELSTNRFVEIIDEGDFPAEQSMVSSFDIAVSHGSRNDYDYLLFVEAYVNRTKIDDFKEVYVPKDSPALKGFEVYMGYEDNVTYNYSLFDLNNKGFVWEEKIDLPTESNIFTITKLTGERVEEAFASSDQKRRWSFNKVPHDKVNEANQVLRPALSELRYLLDVANVAEPNNGEGWVDYFTDKHFSFTSFIEEESGKVMPFFTKGLFIEPDENGNTFISLFGADEETSSLNGDIFSMIHLALEEVAENHVDEIIEYNGWGFQDVASLVVADIEKLL